MTIRDLIRKLEQYDPERQVILSIDSEGNTFKPVDEITHGLYHPESTWHGEFYPNAQKEDAAASEWNAGGWNVVCLWPIN